MPRLAGLLPLIAYAWVLIDYARVDQLGASLWVCNVANLALGIGLLTRQVQVVWAATTVLLFGTSLWMGDELWAGDFYWHSVLSHIGSALLGVAAIRMSPPPPRPVWWIAWICGALMVGVARVATPPELNVNVAFRGWGPLEGLLPGHGIYLVLNAVAIAAILYVLELGLSLLHARTGGPG